MDKQVHYQIVIADAENKVLQLKIECAELRKLLAQKESLISEAEHTVSFIRESLLPDVENDSEIEDDMAIQHSFQVGMFANEDTANTKAMERLKALHRLAEKNKYSPNFESNISLADATEIILEAVGQPLHANYLMNELARVGRFPPRKNNFISTIRKDHKNRFVNLGGNIWDLRSRQEEVEEVKEIKHDGEVVE